MKGGHMAVYVMASLTRGEVDCQDQLLSDALSVRTTRRSARCQVGRSDEPHDIFVITSEQVKYSSVRTLKHRLAVVTILTPAS